MRIVLGAFAHSAVEIRLGGDVSTGVRAALFHYARRVRSGWSPVGLPGFLRDRVPTDEPKIELELSLDPSTLATLEAEAERQGATLSQLAVHAVFIYLADLDRSGTELSDS